MAAEHTSVRLRVISAKNWNTKHLTSRQQGAITRKKKQIAGQISAAQNRATQRMPSVVRAERNAAVAKATKP